MANPPKELALLGLCRKAGRLAVGEQPAGDACKTGRVKLLVMAADTAENTVKKARKYALTGGIPLKTLPYSKEEMGSALGRRVCALAAVTDAGLAAALQKAGNGH